MATVRTKRVQREKRHRRVRRRVFGTAERPRLSVYRSNTRVHVQLIDDDREHTLAMADSREAEGAENRTEAARQAGEMLAERAREADIEEAVFDRGGNKYHGRVAAVAEGARESGLKV